MNLGAFPLVVELLLLPGLVFLVAMSPVAALKPDTMIVKRLADGLLGVIGLAILVGTGAYLVREWPNLDKAELALSFALPTWRQRLPGRRAPRKGWRNPDRHAPVGGGDQSDRCRRDRSGGRSTKCPRAFRQLGRPAGCASRGRAGRCRPPSGPVVGVAGWEARDVLPAIQGVPLRELGRRTGLSVGYLARIRRGEEVPHQRWWDLLLRVGRFASSDEVGDDREELVEIGVDDRNAPRV